MSVTIDLSDEDTDLTSVRNVAKEMLSEKTRKEVSKFSKVMMGEVTVDEADLNEEYILEDYFEQNDADSDEVLDQFLTNLRQTHEEVSGERAESEETEEVCSNHIKIINYVLNGENEEDAKQVLEEESYTRTVTLPVSSGSSEPERFSFSFE